MASAAALAGSGVVIAGVEVRRALRRLTALHWAWMHAKVSAAVWVLLLLQWTPMKVAAAWGNALTVVVVGLVVAGVLLSVVGLVLSAPERGATRPTPRTKGGLLVELIGLVFMLGGVAAYLLTQFALTFGPEGDQRIALVGLVYFTGALLVARMAMVVHQRRKAARLDRLKGAA